MPNKKVMIIDDNKESLEVLDEVLEFGGYKIIAVNNPGNAMDIIIKENPDLILMDLKMPGKSGLQLAIQIRNDPVTSLIPIIFISAYFKEEHVSLLKLYGFNNFLNKPFNPLDVINRIENVLGK